MADKIYRQAALLLALSGMQAVHADSILKYEQTDAAGATQTLTLSITGRWLRIDREPRSDVEYTLMDTGRMLMFEVDDDTRSYRQTRTGMFYWPEDVNPRLRPQREKSMVGGVRCQMVDEMGAGGPVATHCMAPGSGIGLNERKTKTLSRLFLVARRMGLGLGGVSTPDERQVSVSSQDVESGRRLTFVSIEHVPIPDQLMKIPDSYKAVPVNQKSRKVSP